MPNISESPCFYCGRVRRRLLVEQAQSITAGKIALGHQRNDFAETLLMNIAFGGKAQVFAPKIDYPAEKISIIRPLVYLDEQTTDAICRKYHLPVVANPCPHQHHSQRAHAKKLLAQIEKSYPNFAQQLINALENLRADDLWFPLQ